MGGWLSNLAADLRQRSLGHLEPTYTLIPVVNPTVELQISDLPSSSVLVQLVVIDQETGNQVFASTPSPAIADGSIPINAQLIQTRFYVLELFWIVNSIAVVGPSQTVQGSALAAASSFKWPLGFPELVYGFEASVEFLETFAPAPVQYTGGGTLTIRISPKETPPGSEAWLLQGSAPLADQGKTTVSIPGTVGATDEVYRLEVIQYDSLGNVLTDAFYDVFASATPWEATIQVGFTGEPQ